MRGFIAYPSQPHVLGDTIKRAMERDKKRRTSSDAIQTWEETDICGRFLNTAILGDIDAAEIFIADVTFLNFNVSYEIGYAVGRKKRLLLVVNTSLSRNTELAERVGIFDSIGYETYDSSDSFYDFLGGITTDGRHFLSDGAPARAPIYLVESPIKSDFETRIKGRIKKTHLGFRSYDPDEQGRMQGPKTINEVEKSAGVVVHLLQKERNDAEVHNLRAAFVAGLASGLERELLFLQIGDHPVPLDYRDLVQRAGSLEGIDSYVSDFAGRIYEKTRQKPSSSQDKPLRLLDKIDIGASAAENELETLGNYYIDTDEYRRVLRGGIQIVVGRKGSGKTALFLQARNSIRRNKSNIVLDLMPEGYQLRKLKDSVMHLLQDGSKEHLLIAFWEYLLLLETCYKLLEKDRTRHLNDHNITGLYRDLREQCGRQGLDTQADFSERLLRLMDDISEDIVSRFGHSGEQLSLSNDAITELVYKRDVAKVRKALVEYLKLKGEIWILFDNIDKGWPATGLSENDLLIVRCLAEAMRKYENTLKRVGLNVHCVMFLRNDVYERLLNYTPDRGKASHVLIDWTSDDLMKEILRRRILSSTSIEEIGKDADFDEVWGKIALPLVYGQESSSYLVERCLMRPRGLLDLFQSCLAQAVNLGHDRITEEDIREGEESYSTELVKNIGLELRDNESELEDLLYYLVESDPLPSRNDLERAFKEVMEKGVSLDAILDVLLFFGVVGIADDDADGTYIYDVSYDIKRLRAMAAADRKVETVFTINKAFWKGLGIKA